MDVYPYAGMYVRHKKKCINIHWGERMMELHLQFGYGMMEHCDYLVRDWGGGTVILSPRDLTNDQLHRLATRITSLPNGRVLLDPQFYIPRADHPRLTKHNYWPKTFQTGRFFAGPQLSELIQNLLRLNNSLNTRMFILPGILAARIDDDWLDLQRTILEEAHAQTPNMEVYQTIALSEEAI
ncbi:MAG: hypothetical protein NT023_10625, partial [Armatimonadetes bacterium]|nr:hypothetical protein [Armatimonadota bacterium]